MTYREAVAWLYGQQLHGIRPGLETMRRLCAELDLKLDWSGSRKAIHVAGTNGKGSVCAMADAICRASGLRTGLYTSPHLVTFRERIRIDGGMIAEADVAAGITRIVELIAGWDPAPTFFEIVTALALWHFQRQRCEVAVLETGMGGRLDATNVIEPAVSVITAIGLDHQQWLGGTVAEIAGEKAGIIKPGVPVVIAPQSVEVENVLREYASAIFVRAENARRLIVGLPGEHQRDNAATVIAAIRATGLSVGDEAIAIGLREVKWPGRFQRVGERIVLDGAHNPAAAAALVRTWRGVFGEAKATLVLGAMRDKDVRGVCATLAPIAARVLTVRVENVRSCSAEEMAAIVQETMPGAPVEPAPSLTMALVKAKEAYNPTLIAGSLFLVGEALVALGLAENEGERSAQ